MEEIQTIIERLKKEKYLINKEIYVMAAKIYANEKIEKASEIAYNAIWDNTHSASEVEQEILKLIVK